MTMTIVFIINDGENVGKEEVFISEWNSDKFSKILWRLSWLKF